VINPASIDVGLIGLRRGNDSMSHMGMTVCHI
jgi:hypothetical protein